MGWRAPLASLPKTTKLCGVVDVLEGRDSAHRDLYMTEKWAQINLMKFNKTKNKVLQPGAGQPLYNTRLVENGLRAALRNIQRCWLMRSST